MRSGLTSQQKPAANWAYELGDATTDQSSTDALLGPLADNGGPTSRAFGAGSPAIDAADAGACPTTGQRDVSRPQGGGCDAGAFELTIP